LVENLSALVGSINTFFEKVMVMSDDVAQAHGFPAQVFVQSGHKCPAVIASVWLVWLLASCRFQPPLIPVSGYTLRWITPPVGIETYTKSCERFLNFSKQLVSTRF
jgi:hypothetical protein